MHEIQNAPDNVFPKKKPSALSSVSDCHFFSLSCPKIPFRLIFPKIDVLFLREPVELYLGEDEGESLLVVDAGELDDGKAC